MWQQKVVTWYLRTSRNSSSAASPLVNADDDRRCPDRRATRCAFGGHEEPQHVTPVRQRRPHPERVEGREADPVQRLPAFSGPLLNRPDSSRQLGGGANLDPDRMPRPEDAQPHSASDLCRLRPRGVEGASGGGPRVAKRGTAGPEVDAGRGRLRRVLWHPRKTGPAPRPNRVEGQLARHLAGRESFTLDDAEPARCAEPGLPAPARMEAQCEPDPVARDSDRREVPDRAPQLEAEGNRGA